MTHVSFEQRISTEEELRELLGYPSELVRQKVINHWDRHYREFIDLSPFILMSTANLHGECDVSPRGDSPGFALVLDDKHLVIPERPGNRRMDSLRNILSNPYIGLIFLIPGLEETLRVNGKASILRDESLLGTMGVNGRTPMVAIGIEVEECYIHCAKSLKRSRLWQAETWPDLAVLPNPA
ncbi:MAG: phosphohydrolase, partial [Alicyclobacillus sp. RIFOXYA1_FULL_53_8]